MEIQLIAEPRQRKMIPLKVTQTAEDGTETVTYYTTVSSIAKNLKMPITSVYLIMDDTVKHKNTFPTIKIERLSSVEKDLAVVPRKQWTCDVCKHTYAADYRPHHLGSKKHQSLAQQLKKV